ncbi:hypothetical protein NDU88_010338 [Pleurodeles waltl]|uniref:Uncharacterized protein n=1 Tax=Pleurodeles waltl TaxID=8319 RepID=A0AAV7PUV6_PLEWA|nr:hypothetical protein NDU88_010338 [Pleurodeles waltl]
MVITTMARCEGSGRGASSGVGVSEEKPPIREENWGRGGEAPRPEEITLCGLSKSCKSPLVENKRGRLPHPVGLRSSEPGRRSFIFGAEQAPSTKARGGLPRRPRSVPPSPILLQSRRSGEAGLPARPTLTGPHRMPGCNSAPGSGLAVPVALRPQDLPLLRFSGSGRGNI